MDEDAGTQIKWVSDFFMVLISYYLFVILIVVYYIEQKCSTKRTK